MGTRPLALALLAVPLAGLLACDDPADPADDESTDAPTLVVTIGYPDSVAPTDRYPAYVRVLIVEENGDTASLENADVAITVTGGSADSPIGRTDEFGWYEAVITPAASASSLVIAAGATFDGAVASASHTAKVQAGRLVFVQSHFTAEAVAWVRWKSFSVDDDMLENVHDLLSYQNVAQATATHDSIGSITVQASAGTFIALAGDELESVTSSGSASMTKESRQGFVTGGANIGAGVRFEVVGARRAVRVTASVSATPQNYASDVDGESARGRVRLVRIDDDDYSLIDDILDVDSWDGDSPLDTTIALHPGLYDFTTSIGAHAESCVACEVESESAFEASLVGE